MSLEQATSRRTGTEKEGVDVTSGAPWGSNSTLAERIGYPRPGQLSGDDVERWCGGSSPSEQGPEQLVEPSAGLTCKHPLFFTVAL